MVESRNKRVVHENAAEQELREQEVLRANRELAAYFKGRRTEREARAALKIIKAFVRDRERTDVAKRRPLPVIASVKKATNIREARKEWPGRAPRRAHDRGDDKGKSEPTPPAEE